VGEGTFEPSLQVIDGQVRLVGEQVLGRAEPAGSRLDGLVRESAALRHTLDAAHASVAGRLVAFARSLLAGVLPPGTRRRQVFTAVLAHVTSRLPAGSRPRKVLDPRTS
jgi:hypothetical protein